ncbi:uncharacterized protein LOC118406578 [Branchiostoma floridae]|uniref:Uncharacterized protein LOC118406578 n=1 Tax=Branchiostoma floridae TaxID=7739 RepID=A0A9J7HN32_BRAFL|nr:uncharacterized protein LOC118406578 [Branchiostoma floridae]
MPRRKPVPSLRSMCLTFFRDFDRLAAASQQQGVTVNRLIRRLPLSIVEDLLQTVPMSPVEALQFLHPYLKKFNIFVSEEDLNESLIDQYTTCLKTSKGLRQVGIKVSGDVLMGQRFIGAVLRSTTKLVQLNVSDSPFNDDLMEALAISCPSLQDLNISKCKHVTNVGLITLYCPGDEMNSGCRNLTNLNVSSTSLTCDGVLFALQGWPNLLKLDADMLDFPPEGVAIPSGKYKLKTINFPVRYESLEQVHHLFPNLRSMDLSNYGVHYDEAPPVGALGQLQFLEELSIDAENFPPHGIDIFKSLGSRIKILELYGYRGVDLAEVAMTFPNLVRLVLFGCHFVNSGRKYPSKAELPKLRAFMFFRLGPYQSVEESFPAEDFCNLLATCKEIEFLELTSIQVWTPEVIDTLSNALLICLLNRDVFQHLRELQLWYCHRFTTRGILPLVNRSDSGLKKLGLHHCDGLSEDDLQEIEEIIHRNNLDLTLRY